MEDLIAFRPSFPQGELTSVDINSFQKELVRYYERCPTEFLPKAYFLKEFSVSGQVTNVIEAQRTKAEKKIIKDIDNWVKIRNFLQDWECYGNDDYTNALSQANRFFNENESRLPIKIPSSLKNPFGKIEFLQKMVSELETKLALHLD